MSNEFHDEKTLEKVYAVLTGDVGLVHDKAIDVIQSLGNKGILFRERTDDTAPRHISNLVLHAKTELGLLGEDEETTEGILRIVQCFADMGHSGGSSSIVVPIITDLLNYQNLTPLTNDPDEWMHHTSEVWGEEGGVWQNKRNSKAFSHDEGKTYYLLDDITKMQRSWPKRRKDDG